MSDWKRESALMRIKSALGEDTLIPVGFHGHEEIGRPFDFHVSVVSKRHDIDADELLHKPMSVSLRHNGEAVRHFHGLVHSFARSGKAGAQRLSRYDIQLVPGMWFMGQTADCRIFEEMSTTDIVRKLAQEAGIQAPVFRLQNTHKVRPYTTQYNESDLAFATRLLQEEGAYYFFEHTESAHDWIIADHNGAFKAQPGKSLRFDAHHHDDEILTDWRRWSATVAGKSKLIDYDPEKPNDPVEGEQATVLKADGTSSRDVTHWPALTYDVAGARSRARFRLEAEEAWVATVYGGGRNRAFVPGTTFTLAEDPLDGSKGKKFGIQSVTHDAFDETVVSGPGAQTGYTNHFNAFPEATPWRDRMSMPKPRMEGVHAAVVLGNEHDVHVDKMGRIKVRFFWDHKKDADMDHAIWARIAYPWAGNGWGFQSTPRPGTEVIVAFLDGDVDRPLVIGNVYNGENKPIYEESASEKWKVGIRTRSGGENDFNEFTMNDDAGKEMVFLQAQKDMEVNIKNDLKVDIKSNRTTTIAEGNDKLTVSQGNMKVDVSAGKIEIEAMQSIKLTVGQSSIELKPASIEIKSTNITVDAQLQLEEKSTMHNASANGIMKLQGSMILIN